jgi:hypothetical protein
MKKNAALSNVANNNKLVRDRMVAKYGSDFEPGVIDMMFTPNGTKKNFEQFAKDYAAKYNPSLLEGESSGYGEMGTIAALTTAGAVGGGPIGAGLGFLGGLIASGMIDDVDDIYQELDDSYRKTYNSDEVQGLKSGRGSLDDGITGIFSQNRIYSFDPAGKSALKDAVRDLYAKDIAPALKNPSAKGATFLEGNLMNLKADDEERGLIHEGEKWSSKQTDNGAVIPAQSTESNNYVQGLAYYAPQVQQDFKLSDNETSEIMKLAFGVYGKESGFSHGDKYTSKRKNRKLTKL